MSHTLPPKSYRERVNLGCQTTRESQNLTLAWIVTAKAPIEQMAMTLVKTPRAWLGGAYTGSSTEKNRRRTLGRDLR